MSNTELHMSEEELFALPVSVPLVDAGRAFGMGRTKSYELARSGKFPCKVLPLGNAYRVPKACLLEALGFDERPSPANTMADNDSARPVRSSRSASSRIRRLTLEALEALAAKGPEPGRPRQSSPLTKRETGVLSAVAIGATDEEIAEKFALSERTVLNHISKIITKTEARNRVDAVRIAAQAGWI